MTRPIPDPHLAIDRLAKLRTRIAALEAEASAAEAAILALPDGLHDGFDSRVRIDRTGSGGRRVMVVRSDAPAPELESPPLPMQPNIMAHLPLQPI